MGHSYAVSAGMSGVSEVPGLGVIMDGAGLVTGWIGDGIAALSASDSMGNVCLATINKLDPYWLQDNKLSKICGSGNNKCHQILSGSTFSDMKSELIAQLTGQTKGFGGKLAELATNRVPGVATVKTLVQLFFAYEHAARYKACKDKSTSAKAWGNCATSGYKKNGDSTFKKCAYEADNWQPRFDSSGAYVYTEDTYTGYTAA